VARDAADRAGPFHRDRRGELYKSCLGSDSGVISGIVAMDAPPPDAGHSMVVALIEDDPDMREALSDMLAWLGHEVHCAADGTTGLALIAQHRPDVALVDLMLPDIDGYRIAATVRGDTGCDRVRLIAVTGATYASDEAKSLGAGFEAHLVKPFDVDELVRILDGGRES
jgi:CheY-like chemotaxis protein